MKAVFSIEVNYGDRTETVAIGMPDLVAFERTFDQSGQVLSEARFQHFLWLAWRALTRENRESRKFDDFVEDVVSVDYAGEEAAAAPLSEADTGGS